MMMDEAVFESIEGFQWDKGNIEKSRLKHRVKDSETEEVFFNEPLLIFEDKRHSQKEKPYYCLGKTDQERFLFTVFTIRDSNIRIISARDMSKKEREVYAKEIQKSANF